MSLFDGLSVIEVSARGAAATAAKYFADWGASVTILEPPGGTALRDEPPYFEQDGRRQSAQWAWLSRGKSSMRVGEATGLSHAEVLALCEAADVVLIEAKSVHDVLGLQPEELRARLEGKTTVILISPFATTGPYADYRATELGISALGGWMSQLGDPRREPVRPGCGPLPRVVGVFAFVAALVALRHLRQGGRPQFVDVSAQAVVASITTPGWLTKSIWGLSQERTGSFWPLGVIECADGYIGIPPLTAMHWELLCQLMGIADVLDLPEGRDPMWRIRHSAELYERVKPWLRDRGRAQIMAEAQSWRLPAAPVQTIADRLECPQLAARGFWQQAQIGGRPVKAPRVPYSIGEVTPVERGELVEATNVELPKQEPPPATARPPALPFEGVRVLDLTMFWSGPYGMMLLGTLGADVIKIESVQRQDPYRFTLSRPDRERWYELGPLWNDANCDKRGITLDIASQQGRELFERLVQQADVVVSNFSNRVMPNLGLTNKRLLELNPRLIAVTMPGYGPGGPWEEYVGYAIAFEQLIFGSMTGYADGPPLYAGGFCDPLVGMHAVAAIEMALQRREQTGRGLEVEVPQCEILDSIVAPESIAVQLGAPVPSRRGNKHDWMAPHDAYRAAGEDRWITIAVASDAEFAALTQVLGKPELARDAGFSTAVERKENEAVLDAIIAELVAGRDAEELERALQGAGVMACRVLKSYNLTEDGGLQSIGFFQPVDREPAGEHLYKTWPFRFPGIDTRHKRPAPHLGEHNIEVLGGLLGLLEEDLRRLEGEHVIGSEPLAIGGASH